MKQFIVLTLALVVIVIANCTIDKPLPGAYEMIDRADKGSVVIKLFPAVKTASYWNTPLAGTETTLLLGETNNIKAYLLLRFTAFDDGIDTMRIAAATINFKQYSHSGNAAGFQASIYKVTAPWVSGTDEDDWESQVSWETIKNSYDSATSYGTFTGSPQDTITTVSAAIDTSLINEWIDSDTNYGILLAADQTDLVTMFYSSENGTSLITLSLIQQNNDATFDTVSVNVYQDASVLQFASPVAENELQNNPEFLRVGNGSGYSSIVHFDLSSLPAEATIHHALLTMTINKELSGYAESGILIAASPVLSDTTGLPDDMTLYPLSSSPATYAYGDYDAFSYTTATDMKKMVSFTQAWLWGENSGGIDNLGLVLLPYNAGINVSEINFYSGIGDSALAPTLRVTYSLPPSSRFSD